MANYRKGDCAVPEKRIAHTLSLFDLMSQYPSEADGIRYFERIRWGKTPCCVRCGATDRITAQKKKLGDYWCGHCRQYFTARTNTPLERSKVNDFRKWIYASYLLMTSRKGISALQLSKEIGVSYPTAWYMLHRLRLACGSRLEALRGTVEVDEVYLGGKERNKHEHRKLRAGRGPVGKQVVLGMRERQGRLRALPVAGTDRETLWQAIHESVAPGATICTDDHQSYAGLGGLRYVHQSVRHSAQEYVDGGTHTNGIESVWAVLKRGYNGVYHSWSRKHCHRYVNEFAFRLNAGNCERDTQDRLDDLFRGMSDRTITYAELTR